MATTVTIPVEGEVGKVGVAIDSIADMRMLLADLHSNTASMSMTTIDGDDPATAVPAGRGGQGVPALRSAALSRTTLEGYIARGTMCIHRGEHADHHDSFEYCAPRCRNGTPSRSRISHPRGRAAQQCRDRFHDRQRHCLVEAALAAVWTSMHSHLVSVFFWNAHNNFFEKSPSSALRRIWYRLMDERFGAKKERAAVAIPRPDGGSR